MSQRPEPLVTPLTRMFDIDYPIIGAPMFLVSNKEMVVAASAAGGMGSFPALNFRPIENFRGVLREIKQATSKAFAVNIIVQKSNRYQHEQIDVAIEEKVPLIITSLGSPKEIIQRTRGTQTKVFCDVVGLKHARKVAELGADGLILVGSGAGGHAGDISLFALIPFLRQHIDLPMVAAGAIGDGKGLLAALALGADGVYMGTRMIASQEAQVQDAYKQAIIDADCEDIVNTDRVDGFPGNFIRTPTLERVLKANFVDNVLGQNRRLKRAISLIRAGRSLLGSTEQKLSYKNVFSAGHGVASIHEVLPVAEIIHRAVNEYRELKKSLP